MLRLQFYDCQEELHWQEVGFGHLHSKRIVLYLVTTLCSMFCRFCGFVIIKVRKYSMNRVFSHGGVDVYSNTSLFPLRLGVSSTGTIITSPHPVLAPPSCLLTPNGISLRYILKGSYTVRCLFYDDLCPCWRSRSRTLFRNFRHVFTTPIEQVQDINHPLRSLSPLHSIHCYHRQWFINPHTWSKYQLHQ